MNSKVVWTKENKIRIRIMGGFIMWGRARGTVIRTAPIVKKRLCKLLYWAGVTLRRPVLGSRVAPVADLYALNASSAH